MSLPCGYKIHIIQPNTNTPFNLLARVELIMKNGIEATFTLQK